MYPILKTLGKWFIIFISQLHHTWASGHAYKILGLEERENHSSSFMLYSKYHKSKKYALIAEPRAASRAWILK